MDEHRSLLNYSFSRLDPEHGIEDFLDARRAALNGFCGGAVYSAREMAAEYMALNGGHEPAAGEGLETRVFLLCIIDWFAGNGSEPASWAHGLDRLQKRFELTKTVHDAYDDGVVKGIGGATNSGAYADLSMALLLRFVSEGSFNDLNSALKLNDLLLKSDVLAEGRSRRRNLWPVACEIRVLERLCEGLCHE